MPTPIELITDPVSLVVFAMFGGLMLWEALFPGRDLPPVRGWHVRGLVAFAAFFFLSSYLPLWWDTHLARYRLFDLTGFGTLGGAAITVLVYEGIVYAWHRTMHAVPALWRSFHQMHHSAERLDTAGAFFFSPLDMIGWTFAGSLAMVVVVGITPQAATVAILATTFLGIFQHANVRTPRWLGYIIQRPESHTIHHARGIHRFNYSDLPLFDLLFGTFRNPADYGHDTGFYPGASDRLIDMLAFRDVSHPASEPPPSAADTLTAPVLVPDSTGQTMH